MSFRVWRRCSPIPTSAEWHNHNTGQIAYMIDQSHNLKPKIEAMIQTTTTAQELYAKACLVDRNKLRDAQARMDIVSAENCLRDAFFTDVAPLLAEWRKRRGVDPNPLEAYRASGYEQKAAKVREAARAARGATGGSSYA